MAKPVAKGIFDPALLWGAFKDSFKKLDPRALWRNPVMFAVEMGSVITTLNFLRSLLAGSEEPAWFSGLVSLWPGPSLYARPAPRSWPRSLRKRN
jgi:K+-transporting ATPase ATPase B chain